MYGIYHPFEFTFEHQVKSDIIMKVPVLDFILTGVDNVDIINHATGASIAFTETDYSWTIGDVNYTSKRVVCSLPTSGQYVVTVGGAFFSCLIEYSACDILQINSRNTCSNQFHDWDNDTTPFNVLMPEAQLLVPRIITESISIVTQNGEVNKNVTQRVVTRIEYLGVSGLYILLNSLSSNDINNFNYDGAQRIKNISVESTEQADGKYTLYVISFEYYDDTIQASSCCDFIDIDDIINPENPNNSLLDCNNIAVSIAKSGDILTATVTGGPSTGSIIYKWFKDGVQASTSSTVSAALKGDYRVDVMKEGCRASATYLIQDVCEAFSLSINKIDNQIFGSVSNVPSGETVSYSIKHEGTEVSTALPYTATADGIYYVDAVAGYCKKTKAISIKLVDTACNHTIAITDNGDELVAVTNGTGVAYKWELDNGVTKTVVGTAQTQAVTGYGAYILTISKSGCEDKTKFIIKDNIENGGGSGGDCPGYAAYSIDVDYDSNMKKFTVTKNGNESNLLVNDLKWTLNGSNPFDVNNSGIPYSGPVIGIGNFVAIWRIKLAGCQDKFIGAAGYGSNGLLIEVKQHVITNQSGVSFTLPFSVDPKEKVFVWRNGVLCAIVDNPTEVNNVRLNIGTIIEFSPDWPIEITDWVQIARIP